MWDALGGAFLVFHSAGDLAEVTWGKPAWYTLGVKRHVVHTGSMCDCGGLGVGAPLGCAERGMCCGRLHSRFTSASHNLYGLR